MAFEKTVRTQLLASIQSDPLSSSLRLSAPYCLIE
jgi:hypothetical protein